MKNLFTSVAFLLAAFSMQAKEYSGNLNIFVADMGNLNINQNATITVNQQTDGKYELIIKNFYFEAGSSAMNVGTIHVTDVEGKETGDIRSGRNSDRHYRRPRDSGQLRPGL